MKMTEERRKELREFNEQVKIARKKKQEEQLAKWRSEMDKKKNTPKKTTPKKVTPKTYNYKYDTDPLGYQTGDTYRENWFRDRNDYQEIKMNIPNTILEQSVEKDGGVLKTIITYGDNGERESVEYVFYADRKLS